RGEKEKCVLPPSPSRHWRGSLSSPSPLWRGEGAEGGWGALFASRLQASTTSLPATQRGNGCPLEHRNARGPSSGATRHLLPARGEKGKGMHPACGEKEKSTPSSFSSPRKRGSLSFPSPRLRGEGAEGG